MMPTRGVGRRVRDHRGRGLDETDPVDRARVDRWLWAVRVFPSRTDATDACRGGHVRVDGRPAKAATPVSSGRRVEVRVHGRDRVLEVVRPIEKRVGASVAAECYVDHSPPAPPRTMAAPAGVRDRGTGRPTKRDRRRLERLRGAPPPELPRIEVTVDLDDLDDP